MKVVFDTNVLIAAFMAEGVCSKLLIRARKKRFNLILCPFILKEFERILRRKFSATKVETQVALKLVLEASQIINESEKIVVGVCRDSDDDNILSCMIAGKADFLVTGDTDLLDLKEYKGKRIITPREFEMMFED